MIMETRQIIKLSHDEEDAYITMCSMLIEGRERGEDPYFRELCEEILIKLDDFKTYLN